MSDLGDLLAMARNDDPQVRAMVAKSIATIPDPAALSTLVDLLSDPSEQVRVVAIASLGESRQEVAVEPLLPLLEDESIEIRCSVIAALARIGSPRSFGPIVVRLFDVDDEIRKNAAAAVGYLRDARAMEPLLMCLDDADEWVRANSALSLGQLMRSDPIERLIQMADSHDTETVRSNAVSALGTLGAFLADSEDEEEIQGCKAALECVFAALDDASEDVKVRVAAQLALANGFESLASFAGEFALRAFDLTIAVASDPGTDDDLRSTAVWALGLMWSSVEEGSTLIDGAKPAAFDTLVAALRDPHEWCVRYAIEALASIGGDGAKSAIEQLRIEDPDGPYASLCDQALPML